MPTETKTLTFQQAVKADPAQVYHAFTNATALREYLCEVASVVPKPGGRLYLAWDSGYAVMGEYTRLEKDRAVAFTWQGKGEPGVTQVEVSLQPQAGGTLLSLSHGGLGRGEAWERAAGEIEKGWRKALENLASVLETGEDLRFILRPMLGIFVDEFNAQIAAQLQVPVNEGIRLGNVVDGMSAQRAGLEKDDVLVELGGKPLASWTDLQLALQDQRAGDEVALVFYRRAERKHMRMALARRPIPEMPWSAEKLAALVRERSAETAAKLEAALAGVTEAEAGFKPAKEEWSAKEVLAHLILGVRFAQYWLAELVGGQERWADDYAGNLPAGIQALLVAYPTLADLLLELKRSYQAEAAMIAALPADFPEKRKASYWRFAYNWLEPDYHLQEHLEQMAASIQKAKG